MARLVQKFGGTSVADVQLIKKAAEIAVKAAEDGHQVTAVVSAMGHATDHLISLAEQVTTTPSSREMDMLLSTGEQVSIALLTMAIQAMGRPARSFTGAQAGIVTEAVHGLARITEVRPQMLEMSLSRGEIAVVAGFQGLSENQEITTLGRGGSDTTAVALAGALAAERCDIYTDVNGVFTADPRVFSEARRLSSISYEEMLELSLAGAQVMNGRAVELAKELSVPIRVRSTFHPDDAGTLITHSLLSSRYTICGIACDMSQAAVTLSSRSSRRHLQGVSALFTQLKDLKIPADMVMLVAHEEEPTQEVAFVVEKASLTKVQSLIESLAPYLGNPKLSIDTDVARVSVVGMGLSARDNVVAGIFDTLSSNDIPVNMITSGDIRFSAMVPAACGRDAVKLIHQRFGLPANATCPVE